jgi:hypothetical protein
MNNQNAKSKFEIEFNRGLKVISIVLLSMLLLTKLYDYFFVK